MSVIHGRQDSLDDWLPSSIISMVLDESENNPIIPAPQPTPRENKGNEINSGKGRVVARGGKGEGGRGSSRGSTASTIANPEIPSPLPDPAWTTALLRGCDPTARWPRVIQQNPSDDWPPALRKWIERAFSPCKSQAQRMCVEKNLRETIERARREGSLWRTNWDKQPLPSRKKVASVQGAGSFSGSEPLAAPWSVGDGAGGDHGGAEETFIKSSRSGGPWNTALNAKGVTYYWNANGESTYEKPPDFDASTAQAAGFYSQYAGQDAHTNSSVALSSSGNLAVMKACSVCNVSLGRESYSTNQWSKARSCKGNKPRCLACVAQATGPGAPAPAYTARAKLAGRRARISAWNTALDDNGATYYWNADGESTYEKPAGFDPATAQAAGAYSQYAGQQQADGLDDDDGYEELQLACDRAVIEL